MPIDPKTITVYLDASPSGQTRAAHAAALAQRSGAHLVGVHVVFAGVTLHPSACYARGHEAIDQVITHERKLDAAAEAAAALVGRNFLALCARLNVPAAVRSLRRGKPAGEAGRKCLHSNVVA